MSRIDRLLGWVRGGRDGGGEMSESGFGGAAAGSGMGRRHADEEHSLPDDDRGAPGGPPSHDDPLDPRVR